MKKVALGCGLLLLQFLTVIGIDLAPHFRPDVLFLHPSGKPWSSISVTPVDHHTSTVTLKPTDRLLEVSPIVYGPYLICIQYADGEVIWATFWHEDAGYRKRVDIYIDRGLKEAEFRQIANQNGILFAGSVRPEQTSKANPFSLGGP